jgi:hypothetical protein
MESSGIKMLSRACRIDEKSVKKEKEQIMKEETKDNSGKGY